MVFGAAYLRDNSALRYRSAQTRLFGVDKGALGAIRGGRGSLLGCAGAEGRGGVVGGVTGRGRTGGCRGRMDGHGSEIITEPF